MKKIFIITTALLLVINYTQAQHTTENIKADNQKNSTAARQPFKVTKGYYSIYRNAEKLNHQPVTVAVNKNPSNTYTKGFYAIGNTHTQLHKGGKSFIATTPKRPLAAKGYYSIKPAATDTLEQLELADSADSRKLILEAN